MGVQIFGLLISLGLFYYYSITKTIVGFIEVRKIRRKKRKKAPQTIDKINRDLNNNLWLINYCYINFLKNKKNKQGKKGGYNLTKVECVLCKHKVIGSSPIISKFAFSLGRIRTYVLMVNSHLLYLSELLKNKKLFKDIVNIKPTL